VFPQTQVFQSKPVFVETQTLGNAEKTSVSQMKHLEKLMKFALA
jgi:hypothetical protein